MASSVPRHPLSSVGIEGSGALLHLGGSTFRLVLNFLPFSLGPLHYFKDKWRQEAANNKILEQSE